MFCGGIVKQRNEVVDGRSDPSEYLAMRDRQYVVVILLSPSSSIKGELSRLKFLRQQILL